MFNKYFGQHPDSFVCPVCFKIFAEKFILKFHMKIHAEKNEYACNICAKKFTGLRDLMIHKMIHIDENRFKCLICGDRFGKEYLLRKHRKIHAKSETSTGLDSKRNQSTSKGDSKNEVAIIDSDPLINVLIKESQKLELGN